MWLTLVIQSLASSEAKLILCGLGPQEKKKKEKKRYLYQTRYSKNLEVIS